MKKSLDETFPPPPFEGFAPAAATFFRNLATNMDRAWFMSHKDDYERHVKAPMLSLVAAVSGQLEKKRIPLRGDPEKALFRINRDVRFSKNKAPDKTHAGAVLTPDGKKGAPGLLYIHFAADRSFTAAGFFRVEPPVLQKLRKGLVADPSGWAKVERALAKAGLAMTDDEALTRLPKGFENAPAGVVEPLKMKSWIVRRELSKTRLADAALVDDVASFAKDALPLLEFGWSALGRS